MDDLDYDDLLLILMALGYGVGLLRMEISADERRMMQGQKIDEEFYELSRRHLRRLIVLGEKVHGLAKEKKA